MMTENELTEQKRMKEATVHGNLHGEKIVGGHNEYYIIHCEILREIEEIAVAHSW